MGFILGVRLGGESWPGVRAGSASHWTVLPAQIFQEPRLGQPLETPFRMNVEEEKASGGVWSSGYNFPSCIPSAGTNCLALAVSQSFRTRPVVLHLLALKAPLQKGQLFVLTTEK